MALQESVMAVLIGSTCVIVRVSEGVPVEYRRAGCDVCVGP